MTKLVNLALAVSVVCATVIVPLSLGQGTASAGIHQKGCGHYDSTGGRTPKNGGQC
jgi:hypothetical protein